MKFLRKPIWLIASLYALSLSLIANQTDTSYYEIWEFNSLEEIGSHKVSVKGNPELASTDIGNAIEFDGDGDQLLIDNNPIGDAKEFTVEVVFKPNPGINIQNEPRFIHIGEANNERVMMEIRVNNQNQWYLDGYMKTDKEELALIDDSKTHPTGEWMHAAITYKNNTLTTFVNGNKELSGNVGFNNLIVKTIGQTSVGARMDGRNYYSGLVKTLKITHEALDSNTFMSIEPETPVNINFVLDGQNLEIYPNPANQFVNVVFEADGIPKQPEIYIFNTLGKTVYGNLLEDGLNCIKTSTLGEGLYFMTIKVDEQKLTRKIVVNH